MDNKMESEINKKGSIISINVVVALLLYAIMFRFDLDKYLNICAGRTIVLIPGSELQQLHQLAQVVARYAMTFAFIYSTPLLWLSVERNNLTNGEKILEAFMDDCFGSKFQWACYCVTLACILTITSIGWMFRFHIV
jgi:magnesium-transporting ATPase (P-type)